MELKRRVQKFHAPGRLEAGPDGIITGMMPVVPKGSPVTGTGRHIATATSGGSSSLFTASLLY
jgi:hypothetical protein